MRHGKQHNQHSPAPSELALEGGDDKQALAVQHESKTLQDQRRFNPRDSGTLKATPSDKTVCNDKCVLYLCCPTSSHKPRVAIKP